MYHKVCELKASPGVEDFLNLILLLTLHNFTFGCLLLKYGFLKSPKILMINQIIGLNDVKTV